jgi:hypothetical protein
MNVSELILAKLTPGEEQVPQDEEHEGCYDELVRGLDRRLLVNYSYLHMTQLFSYFI